MKHFDQIISLLKQQIGNDSEVADIVQAAREVSSKWVHPLSGGKEETNGLVYGLVQSGKTGVLTACAALAADEGYRAIVILTSDNDALYDQTLDRAREAFPGLEILGKSDLKDSSIYLQRIRSSSSVTVVTKNSSILKSLIENLKKGNVKGLSALLVDDEADQASPNTKESKEDGSQSTIYRHISELRKFFDKNTYLQVTATPQALFLQAPGHSIRPKFTVLSRPGGEYVGGEDFFAENSSLVRVYDIAELPQLSAGSQPRPSQHLPRALVSSLDTFMLAATFKRQTDPSAKSAYLCHVSTKTTDHRHLVDLFMQYKRELSDCIKTGDRRIIDRLRLSYDDLVKTDPRVDDADFEELIKAIGFYSPGIAIKLVNGDTDEDVALKSMYNLFVGGTKLGRGVTIKNLLVSYYGRNPKSPQADTVLQHARMFGYRRKDIGLLRLYLPQQLLTTFSAIHKMERGLRDLIARKPGEEFRGVFLDGNIKATRRNVLAPGALGVYSASSNYNPYAVVRASTTDSRLMRLDELLGDIIDRSSRPTTIAEIVEILRLTNPDEEQSQGIWNTENIAMSLLQIEELIGKQSANIYVRRNTDHSGGRDETRGILDSGEVRQVPSGDLALFMLRLKPDNREQTAWWPQVRFPDGNFAFAFAV